MVSRTADQPRKPQARVVRTQQRVLSACGRLFVEQGFEHVSVEQILQHTGVARSTFYRWFDNKEAVLAELTRPVFIDGEKLLRGLRHLQGRQLMREVLGVYVTLWESHSDGMVLSVRLGMQYRHIIGAVHDRFVAALVPLVAKVQRDGVLRNGDARLSTVIIARTCITVLQIYQQQRRRRELFISSMEGMLLN